MLALAKGNLKQAKLIEGDVTQNKDLVSGPFDLVTSFRFFLQAEESLRFEVLKWMRTVIADDGYFIANFHMNPTSVRGAIRKVQAQVKGKTCRQLSIGYVEQMLFDHGFEIEELIGYSHMFYRSVPRGTASLRRKTDSARTH